MYRSESLLCLYPSRSYTSAHTSCTAVTALPSDRLVSIFPFLVCSILGLLGIMENLVIRPATESDQADCEAVYEACLLKMPDVKGAVSEINEMLLMDWKHENYHQQGYPILVALLDNVLVGVGCLAPEKGWMKPALSVGLPHLLNEAYKNSGAEAAIIVKPSLHRRQIASRIWLALLADPFVKEKDIYVIYGARLSYQSRRGANRCCS